MTIYTQYELTFLLVKIVINLVYSSLLTISC